MNHETLHYFFPDRILAGIEYVKNKSFALAYIPLNLAVCAQATGRVFYIEVSGGIKLQGLGLTDEPIFDIRGRAVLEFGDFLVPFDADRDGQIETGETTTVTRFTLDASGTIKIIKLGNIGSAAAHFVLQTGQTPSGNPELWGVAKIQANLEFLEAYGVFIEGSATLQAFFSELLTHGEWIV